MGLGFPVAQGFIPGRSASGRMLTMPAGLFMLAGPHGATIRPSVADFLSTEAGIHPTEPPPDPIGQPPILAASLTPS